MLSSSVIYLLFFMYPSGGEGKEAKGREVYFRTELQHLDLAIPLSREL
jgi:hypothetical protein